MTLGLVDSQNLLYLIFLTNHSLYVVFYVILVCTEVNYGHTDVV